MAEVAAAFEAVVREFPTQWFQFVPFWPADGVAGPRRRLRAASDASRERLRASR